MTLYRPSYVKTNKKPHRYAQRYQPFGGIFGPSAKFFCKSGVIEYSKVHFDPQNRFSRVDLGGLPLFATTFGISSLDKWAETLKIPQKLVIFGSFWPLRPKSLRVRRYSALQSAFLPLKSIQRGRFGQFALTSNHFWEILHYPMGGAPGRCPWELACQGGPRRISGQAKIRNGQSSPKKFIFQKFFLPHHVQSL